MTGDRVQQTISGLLLLFREFSNRQKDLTGRWSRPMPEEDEQKQSHHRLFSVLIPS